MGRALLEHVRDQRALVAGNLERFGQRGCQFLDVGPQPTPFHLSMRDEGVGYIDRHFAGNGEPQPFKAA